MPAKSRKTVINLERLTSPHGSIIAAAPMLKGDGSILYEIAADDDGLTLQMLANLGGEDVEEPGTFSGEPLKLSKLIEICHTRSPFAAAKDLTDELHKVGFTNENDPGFLVAVVLNMGLVKQKGDQYNLA